MMYPSPSRSRNFSKYARSSIPISPVAIDREPSVASTRDTTTPLPPGYRATT